MTSERKRPKDSASWDKRYVDNELPWDSGRPDEHLAAVIKAHGIKPGRALEIGCGTGTNSIWLAQQGFKVTGMDISPTAIARAEEKAAAAGVNCRFLVGDFMVDQAPGAPFAFVYDRGCLHVFEGHEELSRFASRVRDVLAPDGIWHSLIGSTDGPPRDTGPPRQSATAIVAAVEPWFEVLELRSTTFDNEEHKHARAWVLVAQGRVS